MTIDLDAIEDSIRRGVFGEAGGLALIARVRELEGLVREYAAVQREHDRQLRESADGVESERHAAMYQGALKRVEELERDLRIALNRAGSLTVAEAKAVARVRELEHERGGRE